MMGPRSSLEFRSNIYPVSTKGKLVDDRKFLRAISDPEALDILWHYHGTRGSMLNALQNSQREKAMHCAYAEEGDYPWGTPVGGTHLVCLCERTDCPLYRTECSKRHPKGFKPQLRTPVDSVTKERVVRVNATLSVQTKTPAPKKTATRRLTCETVNATPRPKASRVVTSQQSTSSPRPTMPKGSNRTAPTPFRPWTRREDAVLYEMYPLYGISVRKWTKQLPGRSIGEILDRAHELSVRYVSQRERESRQAESRVKTNSPKKSVSAKEMAAKKAHREAMRKRPWDTSEDAILRRMYPIYGADMIRWTEKLKYRTKPAIEARARKLGL